MFLQLDFGSCCCCDPTIFAVKMIPTVTSIFSNLLSCFNLRALNHSYSCVYLMYYFEICLSACYYYRVYSRSSVVPVVDQTMLLVDFQEKAYSLLPELLHQTNLKKIQINIMHASNYTVTDVPETNELPKYYV